MVRFKYKLKCKMNYIIWYVDYNLELDFAIEYYLSLESP